jgi:hypothetical protein
VRHLLPALLLLLQGVMTPGAGVSSGDIDQDDDRRQIPTQTPHTLERACTTRLGICRVANHTPPGQPCYCVAGNGARLDAYVIAWRWTAAPTDIT